MRLTLLTEDDIDFEQDDIDFEQDTANTVYNTPQSASMDQQYNGVVVSLKYPVGHKRYKLACSGKQLRQTTEIVKGLLKDPVKLLRYLRKAEFEQY